ncbi:MAG: DNA replication/repair protein RecF [Eubacterium sp.]|nr:DNA replication/repair protein RecF [Eubacterium sp.]
MWVDTVKLKDFRNYKECSLTFDENVTFLYGENGQGKTNILEALYLCSTTKSHRGAKEKDLIRFGCEEAHIKTEFIKNTGRHYIDYHVRKNDKRGVAIDGMTVKKASDFYGFLKAVMFSPEDLMIVKSGPAERRKYLDREISQTSGYYMKALSNYNHVLLQRNKLLKDIYNDSSLKTTLDVWDDQLVFYGELVINQRREFIKTLQEILKPVHKTISGGKEDIRIVYQPNAGVDYFKDILRKNRERDIINASTTSGPHRDDFSIIINGYDCRSFGSQGQIRSAALSLKMAEIRILKNVTHETPILLLDDVLSELDGIRQECLLSEIKGVQTIMTGAGIDEYIRDNIRIDKVYYIKDGTAAC